MDIARAFLDRSRHYLVREYPTKIQRCLDVLPADALWRRDDASENSVGNLLLHLSGNVRQWIVSGVGGAPDARRRSTEFDARDGEAAVALMADLRATLQEANAVLSSLDAPSLVEARRIQGRDVSVVDAVYNGVAHLYQQKGQINQRTKRNPARRVQL
jgi:hypothetical protein